MKTNFTQQEILLMTGTNFTKNSLCKKNTGDESSAANDRDQLEEACWNGLLQEMLPEIYVKSAIGKKLYLWQIREAGSFLEIELGELPLVKDGDLSIDPYTFMETKVFN